MTHVANERSGSMHDADRPTRTTTSAWVFTRTLVFTFAVAVVTACGSVPSPSGLMVQTVGGAATAALDDVVLSGVVRISVPSNPSYRGVAFYLGSTESTDPYRFVASAPYDFELDTATLVDGSHLLEAYADLADGGPPVLVGSATFLVANAAGGEHGDLDGVPGEPQAPRAPHVSEDYAHLRQLYVSPTGADHQDGSASAPLATVMEALTRAVADRNAGIGTRINLVDGVYREALVRYIGSSGALIVIEAINPGRAVISGADVFTDWQCSAGVCTHRWTQGWGADPDPWGFGIGELARRRELVVVDGVNLEQVLSRSALVVGSFYVDAGAGTLYLRPPVGTTLDGSVVEVGVRPHALRLQGLDDLVIRGLRFRHAASPFVRSAVEIVDQTNVLLENVWVEWNGQNGLFLKGTYLTVRGVAMNHNGGSGVSGFQVADLLLEDSESSHNNWRGFRAGYDDWDVGNKLFAAHRVVIRRHTSTFNYSRGLWFDIDVEDVLIEDSVFSDNTSDGMFIEKVRGPITVRRSEFVRNGDSGILTSATNNFVLEGSRLELNRYSAVNVSGDFDVSYTNFETGERYTLNNRAWRWYENTMTAPDGAPIVRTTHSRVQWDALIDSSTFDRNTYTAAVDEAFSVPGHHVTFDQWRSDTGQDTASTFLQMTFAASN